MEKGKNAIHHKKKARNRANVGFLENRIGAQDLRMEMEYNQYYHHFSCIDPEDEDVMLEPISYYLEKGFREIDLRLCNRIESYDFAETKKLLEQGANPSVDLDETGDSAISMIADRCTFLLSCEVMPEFTEYEKKGKALFNISMFDYLLGLAASEEMYSLLELYSKEE